jgi:SPP1 family phage portal protein
MDIKKINDTFDSTVRYRRTMYNRYTTEYIPIKFEENPEYLQTDVDNKSKPDRRLYNHYEKEIVDTKVSYFIGHPVIVSTYDNNDNDLYVLVDDFNININYEDLFAELTKDSAISGIGGVLMYKDSEAVPQAMILKPYEFIVNYELKDPVSAMRKYVDKDDIITIEYFDKDYIYTYKYKYI